MAANGAPLHLVLKLWALVLLSFLSHTFPMGLLMAVVTSAGRLATDLEVVAFNAAGVSPLRLFRPFLVAAARRRADDRDLDDLDQPVGLRSILPMSARAPPTHRGSPDPGAYLHSDRRSRRLHRGGGVVDVRAPRGARRRRAEPQDDRNHHGAARPSGRRRCECRGPSCGSSTVSSTSRDRSRRSGIASRGSTSTRRLSTWAPRSPRPRRNCGTPKEAVHLGFGREHARPRFFARGGEGGDVRRRIPQAAGPSAGSHRLRNGRLSRWASGFIAAGEPWRPWVASSSTWCTT